MAQKGRHSKGRSHHSKNKRSKGNVLAQKKRARQRKKKVGSKRSPYDREVDQILKKNISKLKSLGRYNENNKRDPYGRTDGEDAVARSLIKKKIRYVPEYYLGKLSGDNLSFRVADFYLPKEKVLIEFLGNWNTSDEHKERYREKKKIYAKNGWDCIYIYPNQLYNISWILDRELKRVLLKRSGVLTKKEKDRVEERDVNIAEKVEVSIYLLKKFGKAALFFGLLLFVIGIVYGIFSQNELLVSIGGILLLVAVLLYVIAFIIKITYSIVVYVIVWIYDLIVNMRKLSGK